MENSFPHRIFCIAYLLCHFCGQLSTEIAESCALRSVRRPPRGQKGRDTCGFPSSLNSCLSLVRSSGADQRPATAPKIGNGRGFFLYYGRTAFVVRPLEQPVRSVRYRSATHVISSAQARHNCVAQLVCTLLRPAPANVGVRQHLFSQALSIITRSRIARHGYAALCWK